MRKSTKKITIDSFVLVSRNCGANKSNFEMEKKFERMGRRKMSKGLVVTPLGLKVASKQCNAINN